MNKATGRRWGINGFTLKSLAMVTMLVDHTGMALFPQEIWMRYIGRLAFPIYCFLLVEGAVHTSNRGRYLKRLLLFAGISELPFDLVRTGTLWDMRSQNVFFTLFLGLLAIHLMEYRPLKEKVQNYAYRMVIAAVIAMIADYGGTDYGSDGILMILCLYLFYQQKYIKLGALAAINLLFAGIGSIQSYAACSIVPILCYNGKRGPKLTYIFYIFYPAHLFILYWLRFRM